MEAWMDRAEFWAMVEAARPPGGGDCAQHAARLMAALAELPAAEILTYQHIQDQLMAESCRWDLWGAAYLLNFGCSDDGFDYFRGWLLTQGRAIWEDALQDPDGLAELPQVRELAPRRRWESWFWCHDILGVAHEAYQRRTGQPVMPETVCDIFGAPARPSMWSPGGESWDAEDDQHLRRRWPRLFAWHQSGDLP
jgi:Protein of unknown function (DUF4240)